MSFFLRLILHVQMPARWQSVKQNLSYFTFLGDKEKSYFFFLILAPIQSYEKEK